MTHKRKIFGTKHVLSAVVVGLAAGLSVTGAMAASTLDASDGTPASVVSVDANGKVGINTTTPAWPMELVGDVMQITNSNGGFFRLTSSNGSLEMAANNDANTYIDFKGQGNTAQDYIGRLLFNDNNGFTFLRAGGGVKVGIGTAQPQSTLAVKGKITAQEVEVTLSGWADYVFEPDYKLPSLKEVKAHIDEFGHLPDVRSAQEIEKQGLNLGESQAKLMQKIEELTLYVISLNDQLEAQSLEMQSLRTKLEE